MEKKEMAARVIRDIKYGGKSLQINCPLIFRWNDKGDLDYVYYDIPKGISSYQKRLIHQSEYIINSMIDIYNEMEEFMDKESSKSPLPDFLKKEFPDDFKPV
jgi:hypothetical protein